MDMKERVREQFAKTAEAYLVTETEVKEKDLLRMIEVAELQGTEALLDIATATGRTLVGFAPGIEKGIGLDLTPEMLTIAKGEMEKRGIENVTFVQGDAENLPFAEGTFDLVTARICAHHYPNPDKATEEMARVLRPGGRVIMADLIAPEDDALDVFINRIEKMRDTSHVREWKISEWEKRFQDAGLAFTLDTEYSTTMSLRWWTGRSQTPQDVVDAIVAEFRNSTGAMREMFAIEEQEDGDWHFRLLKAIMIGRKQ